MKFSCKTYTNIKHVVSLLDYIHSIYYYIITWLVTSFGSFMSYEVPKYDLKRLIYQLRRQVDKHTLKTFGLRCLVGYSHNNVITFR